MTQSPPRIIALFRGFAVPVAFAVITDTDLGNSVYCLGFVPLQPRGAAKLDVLVLFASRCYTMLLRGDLDILFEY